MKHLLITIILYILLFNQLVGQNITNYNVSNSTLISSENQPFWFRANQDGKIISKNSFLNLTDLSYSGIYHLDDSISHFSTGTDIIAGLGNKSQYFQINELFAGFNFKNWEVKAGLWVNDMQFGGLSTSNGNIAKSRNSRPHPRISFLIPDYKPIPWIGKYVMFKGEFEEGWLNDDRYVMDTHLHHKSFYLKFQLTRNFDLQGGLEHFVMWGGTSQDEKTGKMPTSVSAYLKYITGQSGSNEFLPTDQLNVAGNQYGTYQFMFTYYFPEWKLALNISHPFDDLSGMNLRNWKDNLLGLYISTSNRNGFITDIIYEYTDTRNQSARSDSLYIWHEIRQEWRKEKYDNYFNHGIYKSGATYQKMAMVSPLFFPVIVENNINMGFESNKFIAHHLGAKGKLANYLSWKGMVTYIQHLGTYQNPYENKLKQLSTYFEVFYYSPRVPVNIGLEIAADKIKNKKDNLGIQFSISKSF